MGKESNEASADVTDATATSTKKRRFPIPFRKKPKSSASDDDNNNNNKGGSSSKDAVPLNGSSILVPATTGAAAMPDAGKATASKVPSKVTIVEPSKAAAAAASDLPRPPSRSQLQSRQSPKTSWLCRTKSFQNMCDWAFQVVDQDGSGSVDEKELYSGLLLIHLKLGSYAGPAACKPLELEKVRNIFKQFDADNSGSLDKSEFREVMMVLFGNVLLRVIVQWTMTLLIVPLVAKQALDGVYWLWGLLWAWVADLDQDSHLMNSLEIMVEETRDAVWEKQPAFIKSGITQLSTWVDAVPDSIWNTIPLTLLSCILGIVVVPYMIFSIDDYFQKIANRKSPVAQPPPPTSIPSNKKSN